MSPDPYTVTSDQHPTVEPKEKSGIGFTLVELLVVIAIIATLVALLLPSVRYSPNAARRMQCRNNLKQIGLALHNYHDTYGVFPPAYTVDQQGRPLHSWRVLLLPYLEQQRLYESVDLSRRWDHPINRDILRECPEIYRCPGVELPDHTTVYLGLSGPDRFFNETQPRSLAEFTDGPNITAAVVEVSPDRAVLWMEPLDADPAFVFSDDADGMAHFATRNALLADGSVRSLLVSDGPAELEAMMTVNGGESDSSEADSHQNTAFDNPTEENDDSR